MICIELLPDAPVAGAHTYTLAQAMQDSQTLARLDESIRASQARFELVRSVLPANLLEDMRPGPCDDTGWTLFVPSGASAAKLRQWLPKLEQALLASDLQVNAIRVRVQART